MGIAGRAGEDVDEGRWWIEGDRFHRQWQRWAWGETGIYDLRREGEQLKLFDEDGWLIDRYVEQAQGELD